MIKLLQDVYVSKIITKRCHNKNKYLCDIRDYVEVNITYIIIPILFFLIGFLVVLLTKIALVRKGSNQSVQSDSFIDNYDDRRRRYDEKNLEFEIIDALLSKYDEKIDLLSQKITEQKIRMDRLELFLKNYSENKMKTITIDSSDKSQYLANDITDFSDIQDIKITDNIQSKKKNEEIGTNTISNVLMILKDGSKSSNEIKNAIGRTREHTGRLMKKLTEMKLVERQSNFKPFKYKISEIGEKYLEESSLIDNS